MRTATVTTVSLCVAWARGIQPVQEPMLLPSDRIDEKEQIYIFFLRRTRRKEGSRRCAAARLPAERERAGAGTAMRRGRQPMSFRAEEDDPEDEACFWQYDSTWEEEEENEEEDGEGGEPERAEAAAEEEPEDVGEQPVSSWARGALQAQEQRSNSSPLFQRGFQLSGGRNWNAAKDLQRYRHHYLGLVESENEEEEEMWNLSFYKNEIRFLPHGLYIDTLLECWKNNYDVLEDNHSYIQWLFPLRERGMNRHARPLTWKEIQAFKKSKEVMQRFVRAYQLMLRFYGIILVNEETGELRRAENWAERFQNLNRFSHNNLRITRILKCLGEMGYEHYQVHLVKFFLTETLVKETLPNVKKSALDYFLFTIRNKRERRELVHYAWQHFRPQSSFVWGPHDKLLKYRPRSAKSQLHQKAEDKQETPGEKPESSVEKDQSQALEKEQEAGDAADLQPEVNNDVKEKISECALKGGGDEEKKEVSLTQQEEKGLNSEGGDEEEKKEVSLAQQEEKGLNSKGGDDEEKKEVSLAQQEEKDLNNEGGDGEDEKEASLTQREEKDLNSDAEEVQGTAENDCTKESKKRKLDANLADTKRSGALKSPDIENIARNLGECAIDAEIPSPVPLSGAEEDQAMLEGHDASTKGSAAPEIADAAVKRRKVDKKASRGKTYNLAINLNMGPSASSAKANPSAASTEAENGNVSEKNASREVASEKSSNDANPGAERPLVASKLPEAGLSSSVSDGLESSGYKVTAKGDQHHCNSMLLEAKSEVDAVERHQKVENASEKGQAEVMGKKQVLESLEQSMASTCPEEDSAGVATQKPESSERAAEPSEEQVAAK
ncbi:opioid growth factor receptor isoform X2 [Melanerpes formicivorus]|uniref:opioid growth factor receptor isoform X2 n=1 Tax=Melanerpes formicivorus TaxID=211600 RepID=UPI00358E6A55